MGDSRDWEGIGVRVSFRGDISDAANVPEADWITVVSDWIFFPNHRLGLNGALTKMAH